MIHFKIKVAFRFSLCHFDLASYNLSILKYFKYIRFLYYLRKSQRKTTTQHKVSYANEIKHPSENHIDLQI